METTPPDKEGHSDLLSELGFDRSGTRSDTFERGKSQSPILSKGSRAQEGRGISVVPETQFEPETETRPEQEIREPQVSVTTCEGGLGAARPSTETASQYITADKPEVIAAFTSQEISSSLSTENTQTPPPHILLRHMATQNIKNYTNT